MLLPEPSLTSKAGRKVGAALETGFFGMEGGAGSFTVPLPGAGPFRSALAFSLSTKAGVKHVLRLNERYKTCRKKNTTNQPTKEKKKKPVTK